MGTIGRPRALDDAQRREVCALISAGCGFRTAAEYVGCSPSTIRREALRNPEFHEQVRSAELSCQLSPLQAIRKAAATNWRAAAWLLERMNPKRFGNQRALAKSADVAEAMIDELFEAIRHEIKDDQLCNRIGIVVRTIVGKWQRDEWAERHHRRNPARAKRLLSEIERSRQPARERSGPKSVFDRAPVDPERGHGFEIDPAMKRQLDADVWPSEANAKCDPPAQNEPAAPNTPPGDERDAGNPSRDREGASSGPPLPPHQVVTPQVIPDWEPERDAELERERNQSRASQIRQEASASIEVEHGTTLPHGRGSDSDKTEAKSNPDRRTETPHQNVFKSVQKSDVPDHHRAPHPSEKQVPIDRPPR